MNIPKYFLCIALTFFFISPSIYAQGEAASDSVYQNYINQAWQDIRNQEFNDSLQNEYAAEFFEYYRENPKSSTGVKAMQGALLMWGNTGNADMMDKGIATFENDSELWNYVPNSMGNAYSKDSTRSVESYLSFLESKKEELTTAEGKSAILTSLLRYYQQMSENKEKVISLAQELVNINASEWYVDFGLGVIYEIESLGLGQEAPTFSATTLADDQLSLADHTGKYIILDFWAMWCGPCIPEIPTLKKIRKAYSEDDLAIISIALEKESEKFTNFLAKEEITWPQIVQPKRWKDEIPTLYNVTGIPQKYVIGPEGTIIAKNLRGDKLVAKMDSLINRK